MSTQTYNRRRGPGPPKALSRRDYPFTMKLPDGRTVFVEIPGRWTATDRSGETVLLPAAVKLVDRVQTLATSIAGRPPSPGFIVSLREGLGLTQKEFGERLGVDKMTVSRWERGAVRPSAESLRAMETLRREAARRGIVVG